MSIPDTPPPPTWMAKAIGKQVNPCSLRPHPRQAGVSALLILLVMVAVEALLNPSRASSTGSFGCGGQPFAPLKG